MEDSLREKFTVPGSATVEQALAVIESNGHRCVIVLDARGRAVGTLSDGDVRRAMLKRRLLSIPVTDVMNLNFLALAPGEEARAKSLAEKHHVSLFPVVGALNELLDIVTTY